MSMTSPSSTAPLVSVIIPSRNRAQLLLETVQSILDGNVVPSELVIIDQSTSHHPELSNLRSERRCNVRYLWTPRSGVSRARNDGIIAASHPILLFTDDDVQVAPDWCATLVEALVTGGPRTVVVGQVRPAAAMSSGGFVPSTKVDPTPAVFQGRIGRDVLPSGNMAIHRSAFDEVGVFDERIGPGTRFSTAEDNDLGYRLLEAGYRIVYEPRAVVYHRAWREKRHYLPLRWSYGRGQGAFYAKHLSLRDPYMLGRLLRGAGDHLWQAFWQLRRERRRAHGHLVYTLGLVSGALEWLLTQRRS